MYILTKYKADMVTSEEDDIYNVSQDNDEMSVDSDTKRDLIV